MGIQFPHRYDIVGSFLRPEPLKQAAKDFAESTITQEEYKKAQQAAVLALVKHEESAGLQAVTDGEFTRWAWHHDFIAALDGIEEVEVGTKTVFQGVKMERLKVYKIANTIRFPLSHPFLDYFKFLHENSSVTAKQTIPGPNMVHMGGITNADTYKASPLHTDFEKTAKDIAAAYNAAIQAFYDAGCRYLQLDDTAWAGLLEPGIREKYAAAGINIDEVLEKFTYLTAESIKNKPDDMALTFHVCRGNFKSSYLYHGAYHNIASKLFSLDKFDGFFLEFDDERSGDFSILRHVGGQRVVLGLVTSKTPELEQEEMVISRIHEAAKYTDLDKLCISPQCGFASTVHGNNLTEQDQWNKITLVKRIAEKVWPNG